jgi:hypothetical protein
MTTWNFGETVTVCMTPPLSIGAGMTVTRSIQRVKHSEANVVVTLFSSRFRGEN